MAADQTPMPEVAVALDFKGGEEASRLLGALDGLPLTYKVGLELFIAVGPDWVRSRVREGKRIFLDLKLHDIPNTVVLAAERIQDLGVHYFTLHLAGGKRMISETTSRLARLGSPTRALGVSVLTSFTDSEWADLYQRPISQSVRDLVSLGLQSGLTGFVCSGWELRELESAHPNSFWVVPGIRPAGSDAQDQRRTLTPEEAMALGAKMLVMGRPITQAKEPRQVAQNLLSQLGVRV
jgi:orotidine-5'-phosphate decarboxylase